MNLTHAASVLGISGGKSAVQHIVHGRPLISKWILAMQINFIHHASAGDYGNGEGYVTANR